MKITELKGKAQVFTLKDGKTFRIFASTTKEIADSKISNEMRLADKMGLILISPISEEVPKNKKGGTK